MNLHDQPAHVLAEQLARKQVSAVDLARAALDRIAAVEEAVGAFLVVDREGALSAAEAVDRRRAAGETLSPLAGVPIALKANMCATGLETNCASRILEGFVPPYDGTVVRKVREAGLVPVGMANMDEFAMGSSTENSAYQKTRNPWDLARVPGGSSGGSAAAVAAGEAPLALGSDTGGSIRQPAALCGVVGLKPTYGLVSRYGLVAFASSLDQIGPMTRDVRDNALLLSIIAGHDPLDSTSLPGAVPDFAAGLEGGVKGLRIGVVAELMGEGIAPEVRDAVRKAADFYVARGAEVTEVSMDTVRHGIAAYYLIATAEASSNLARYDGVKYGHRTADPKDLMELYLKSRAEGFGPEVKRRIMLGTYALSSGYYDAYYKKAQQVRTRIRQDYEAAFGKVDLLLTPTTPTTAFKLGEKTDDPLAMYLEDFATVTVNLAGVPGISLPAGFDAQGLPIGLQLIGPAMSEPTLYKAAYTYEQAHDHVQRRPEMKVPARAPSRAGA